MNKYIILFSLLISCSVTWGEITLQSSTVEGFGLSPDTNTSFGALASSFTTGAEQYSLDSIILKFSTGFENTTPANNGFLVQIFNDNGAGNPGTSLATLNGPTEPPEGFQTFTSSGLTLNPNTKYWVHLSTTDGYAYEPLSAGDSTSSSSVGWSIGNDIYGSKDGWDSQNAMAPFIMTINATASVIPEPVTLGMLFFGFNFLFYLRRKKQRYNSSP